MGSERQIGELLNLFLALFLFNSIILSHDFGRFVAAKFFKIKVTVFSIGFGPIFLKRDVKGTTYAISTILVGGYVWFLGAKDEEDIQDSDKVHAYRFQKPWIRIFITLSGPIMGAIFSILLLTAVNISQISHKQSVGVNISSPYNYLYALPLAIQNAAGSTIKVFDKFKNIATSKDEFKNLSGIMLFLKTVHKQKEVGLSNYLTILAFLNFNIAILSMLPLPSLDGWNILYLVYEWITGVGVKTKTRKIIDRSGVMVMTIAFACLIIMDVLKIAPLIQ